MPSLADIYTKGLAAHPYGRALYHPASTKELRPGTVGFFNAEGLWNPIAHLEDSESLARHGLRFPTQSLTAAKPERISQWFPKTSRDVKERVGGIDLGVDGTASGLPVDAKVQLEYATSTESGAVIITSSPITHEGYHYHAPFEQWLKSNAHRLLSGPVSSDIKEHGLFLATHTYAAEKVALTAWHKSENKAYFGFGVGAMGLAELSPRVGWFAGRSEAGWNVHTAEVGELKVVFAAGLAYRRIWPSTIFHGINSPTSRSASPAQNLDLVSVVEIDGKEITLEGSIVGQSFQNASSDDDDEYEQDVEEPQ